MMSGDFRNWLAIGTGVGVEIRADSLIVTVVRVRPQGVSVLASTVINRFRERPAAEWGAEFSSFLKSAGGGHLAATVLLPRHEVIVRTIPMPGVSGRDLEAAIGFEIDSLHPYAEGDAVSGWSRAGGTASVLIGISHREVVERYGLLFMEAGIRVASFTFSAAALYSGVRLLSNPPAEGVMVLLEGENGCEVYGESGARPVFSALFDFTPERAVALASAELRLDLDDGVEPKHPVEILPSPKEAPPDFQLRECALSYAAALVSACPHLSSKANLLPVEQRSSSSRAVFIPSAVLAVVLVSAVVTWAVYGAVEDRRYQEVLSQEVARLSPEAAKVKDVEAAIDELRTRRQELAEFRGRTKEDMDSLAELTRILDQSVWIRNFQLTRNRVMISGEAAQAATLLEIIDNSPLFQNSEFTAQLAMSGEKERFSIRSDREVTAEGDGR